MVACWGKNFDLLQLGRQAIVCERSVDGGRSWPDAPQQISPPQDPVLPFGPFVTASTSSRASVTRTRSTPSGWTR
jgi:hypothetical protein